MPAENSHLILLQLLKHVGDEKIATLETYFKDVNAKFKIDDDMVDFVSDCAANMAGWGRKVASWTGCMDHRLDLVTKVAFDHSGVADVTSMVKRVSCMVKRGLAAT